MHGFEAGDRGLLAPPVQIEEATRERMAAIVAAVTLGRTPEEISGYLQDEVGFPDDVREMLDRPWERDEVNAHIDLLLAAMQSGELAAAA